jgi:aryl-alcohol dehydrogenase-like predicted oxidoreductase
MALTGIYGTVAREESISVIRRAFDLGITHYDTAELYGPYVNEELLAEALGSRGREVCIATKFGYRLDGSRIAGFDSSPRAIRHSVEGSLRRLRRERITSIMIPNIRRICCYRYLVTDLLPKGVNLAVHPSYETDSVFAVICDN